VRRSGRTIPGRAIPGRTVAALAGVALVAVAVGGCQFTGFGSSSLPFTPGTGSGTYTVTAQVADVNNLAPNSEVMVNDVAVGTVTSVKWDNWHADLTISLPDQVKLPANATAAIGQKSLLGAEYVALSPPASAKAQGELSQGDVIPLASTSAYPSTEDVLASLSTFLNGGGLNQLSTITRELNATLDGHVEQARNLLTNLQVFVGSVNQQKHSIINTLSSVNTLAAQVRTQNKTLTNAIDGIPGGLAVLNKDEGNLTQTLGALSSLSTVADRVINTNSANLLANLHDLQPTLQQLTVSERNLVRSLSAVATFPFPVKTVLNTTKGDYTNVSLILDLSTTTLARAWLTGTLGNGSTNKPASSSTSPLTDPLKILGGGSASGSSSGTNKSGGSSGSSTSGGLGGILGSILGGGNG
jgi:phospholipid/cholesterol/gamma-HCH transport system substrate-binding protein